MVSGENQKLGREREIWRFWKDLDKRDGKVHEGWRLVMQEKDGNCRELQNSDMKTDNNLEDVTSDIMTENEDVLLVDREED